ncbi:MAG: lysine--tRNA ligase [Candidatus Magasanikbacteria bacterium]|nr:lysine--tRNA ligase [Candidatus Magasanikbacteria bacterium]
MEKPEPKIDPKLLKEDVIRLEHLDELRKNNIDPFPARVVFKTGRVDLATAVITPVQELDLTKPVPKSAVKSSIEVVGRIVAKRDIGKLIFCKLRDGSGELQLVFTEAHLGEDKFKFVAKYIDVGDFLQSTGFLFATRTGETSLLVGEYTVLAKALLPLPEKWHGLTDIEQRYRRRYLDLIANNESMRIAKMRSLLVREMRNYFDAHGFYEVETPILQTLYGGALAKPFVTHHNALDIPLYLRIAPELYLKRLIVGGFEKVYEIAKCFRNEGIDYNHNPEFTQIEFYSAYADYNDLMNLTEDLLPKIIKSAGLPLKFKTGDVAVDFTPPYPRISMRDLIKKHAKLDIEDFPSRDAMLGAAKKLLGNEVDTTADRGKLIDDIYKKYVRPHIVNPIFMIDHPVELSPLAKKKAADPSYVERFQLLCIGGNELCNAFTELNDPLDQEARFREQAENEARGNEESMPFDEDFVTALKHGMPPTAGFGMGIDRLVKLLANAENLKEVILFPTLRPEYQKTISPTSNATHNTAITKPAHDNLPLLPMDRAGALELLKKYNHRPASFNHYLESEAVMRALAKRLGKDEDWWGTAGLLHDIDWDLTYETPKNHLTLAPKLLKDAGFPDYFIEVMLSHGYGCECAGLIDQVRTRDIEFALAAGETVTGLVHAAARLRPDKIASLEVKSLLKKFKDSSFAATVNRSVIKECEHLGLSLEEFLQLAIDAIKSIATEVELAP